MGSALKHDPGKSLDIDAIEAAMGELLEHYRQALRAAERLPVFGPVPATEFLAEIASPVSSKQGRINRLRTSLLQTRTRHADWFRIRFAVRSLVRTFLRSHIRSKLCAFADRLEVERLASAHMDANTLKRLDIVIEEVRNINERLALRSTKWLKLMGWIWAIVAPLLITYFRALVVPNSGSVVPIILVYLATYLLLFASLVWAPLFIIGALGGFRWKRLILVGQIGDVNIDIATDAVLRWMSAPQVNTYQSENRLFETIGLPKPSEYPWDLVLSPVTILLAALTLATFIMAWAFSIPATKLDWPILIAFVMLFVSFFCLRCMLRPILRAMRERVLRGTG